MVDPMDVEMVREVTQELVAKMDRQRYEAKAVDSWLRPETKRGFEVPARASQEHRDLADLSRTPWLSLVVTNVAQAMYVDNIVGEDGDAHDLWKLWLDNNMASLQVANHRAMISYGQSFGVATPATFNGTRSSKLRCLSPRRMAVQWDDAATDVYPVYALEAMSADDSVRRWRLYDDNYIYTVESTRTQPYQVTRAPEPHGTGVTPVVRFTNMLDLDGNILGEVTPFIPTAARINKTSYDRLLAQHFTSWKVRTIAGIDLPEETEDADADKAAMERQKMKLAQEDILISEDPETSFSTLDGTSLDTFVAAWRSDIEALAAVSQTPAHALTGQLVNLNAEALAAARAPLTQKVWERQVNAGATYSRLLRLAAAQAGMETTAVDPLLRVTWQDMEIRSMSQAVDALGKAASMLKIPARGLWDQIPGVERSDVQAWERMADEDADADPLRSVLRSQNSDTATDSADTAAPAPEE